MTRVVTRESALARGWRKWLDSEEGQKCSDPKTLGYTHWKFLENRLWRAFMAGAAAATPEQQTPEPTSGPREGNE